MPSPTSSERKRWTMRYRRFEDDTSAIPYVADGPDIDVEPIEVVPASEVERLENRVANLEEALERIARFDGSQEWREVARDALANERED